MVQEGEGGERGCAEAHARAVPGRGDGSYRGAAGGAGDRGRLALPPRAFPATQGEGLGLGYVGGLVGAGSGEGGRGRVGGEFSVGGVGLKGLVGGGGG